MAPTPAPITFFFFHLVLAATLQGVSAVTFTVTNNCGFVVWPGVLSGAGTAPPETTGFALAPGESRAVNLPPSWSGRLWGRSLCAADPMTGRFTCATGDCGSSTVECAGAGAVPPVTLAEFTLDGSGGMDFFDVSLVDGYNLPMLVAPAAAARGGAGTCQTTGCVANLNEACPADLKVAVPVSPAAGVDAGGTVACKSACDEFRSQEYCCTGAYASPATCRPTAYSSYFKNACPRAYSYAYDDSTSTFTCATGTTYTITFCPAAAAAGAGGLSTMAASQKTTDQMPQAANLPSSNATSTPHANVTAGAVGLQAPLLVVAAAAALSLLW